MKRYRIDLNTARGPVTVYTYAKNLETAIWQVLEAEKAPRSACTFWGLCPIPSKQKKTIDHAY